MVVVIVSGFAGCGKSTLARNIGKALTLPVVHASGILKELRDHNIQDIDVSQSKMGQGFWESEEARHYLHARAKDHSKDQALDDKLHEIIDQGTVVVDSKTMCNLSKKGIKIWVEARAEIRARRIAERDKLPQDEVLQRILERDRTDARIYRELYGFELGKDLENVDLLLNNEQLTAEQSLHKALVFIREIQEKKEY